MGFERNVNSVVVNPGRDCPVESQRDQKGRTPDCDDEDSPGIHAAWQCVRLGRDVKRVSQMVNNLKDRDG